MKKTNLLVAAAFALCLAWSASASDIYVDKTYTGTDSDGSSARPYKTIQLAINRGVPGDTVKVSAGVYSEMLVLRDQISVVGTDYSKVTITGNATGSVVQALNLTGMLLKNLTITYGTAQTGGGINVDKSTITIDTCLIYNCSAQDGGGIYASSSFITITDTTISSNKATRCGAGLAVFGTAGSTTASMLTMDNSSVMNNDSTAYGYGGGVWVTCATATIDQCAISYNWAKDGGGLYWVKSTGALRRSTIDHNYISRVGSGMFIDTSDPKLTRNNFNSNESLGMAGGVYFWQSSNAAMYNCLIDHNAAHGIGGAVVIDTCTPKIINDTIVSNTGQNSYGGLCVFGSVGIPTVLNCIFWGNIDDIQGVTVNYCQVQNGDAGTENKATDPAFKSPSTFDYTLLPTSPCVNTGSPGTQYNDRDGTQNDRGYTGGPYGTAVGDVNDDGCVNVLDLLVIRTNLNGDPTSSGLARCDVNKDGAINILDMLAIRKNLNAGCGKPQWP